MDSHLHAVSSVSTYSRARSSVRARRKRNQDESEQPDSHETRRRTRLETATISIQKLPPQHYHNTQNISRTTSPHFEEAPYLTHRAARLHATPYELDTYLR